MTHAQAVQDIIERGLGLLLLVAALVALAFVAQRHDERDAAAEDEELRAVIRRENQSKIAHARQWRGRRP